MLAKDGKPLYILMNNAVHGKTMEDLRNKLCKSKDTSTLNKPAYHMYILDFSMI